MMWAWLTTMCGLKSLRGFNLNEAPLYSLPPQSLKEKKYFVWLSHKLAKMVLFQKSNAKVYLQEDLGRWSTSHWSNGNRATTYRMRQYIKCNSSLLKSRLITTFYPKIWDPTDIGGRNDRVLVLKSDPIDYKLVIYISHQVYMGVNGAFNMRTW